MTIDEEVEARAAAHASRVSIRMLDDVGDLSRVIALFAEIWGQPPIAIEHARALAYTGNYVAGAFDGSVLIGASIAFFGTPLGRTLHSDVTGVGKAGAGRHVGYALKLHQRAWARALGLAEITWTFDPLVARNAHFNINKLGASITAYIQDFYGDMGDAINTGQGSDRVIASWDICRELPRPATGGVAAGDAETTGISAAVEGFDGRPGVERIAVPDDIEQMRRADPAAARAWRTGVRASLGAAIAAGHRVVGFQSSCYLVARGLEADRATDQSHESHPQRQGSGE